MSLPIPAKVLDQHLVMLGKTGAGKSSKLRVLVEHLMSHKKRVCIIDPKGDWWGAKLAADGNSPGLPLILFGEFKKPDAADVPINEQSGKHIAELVSSGNRPCVIGLAGWHQSAMTRFWIDFASTLFATNKGELYLVCDEFHNFAPKGKVLSPQAGESLHWSNRLLSEGRGLGLVCLMASQRPQKVHNDSLTSAETLCALRVVHKADRQAVKDWIDGNGDPDIGKQVLDSLAKMPRTDAWIWSPEIDFGPKQVTFPMFWTFDSFAPPQLQKKISGEGWADVDLDAVKDKLAKVIEERKANDPKELRTKIAELQKQLASRPAAEPKVIEKPVVDPKAIKEVESIVARMEREGEKRVKAAEELIATAKTLKETGLAFAAALGKAAAPMAAQRPVIQRPAVMRVATPLRQPSAGPGDAEVGRGGLRRILIALAQRPGLSNRQIGVRAGLSSSSGSFGTYMSKGRSMNWIRDEGERRFITDEGLAALGDYEPLPTGPDLLSHWLGELGNSGAARILQALADAHPNAMTNEEIGAAAEISHTSGSFGTYMSRLRTLELIESLGRGLSKASDELFEMAEA